MWSNSILLFDPVHCYGLPGYLEIIEVLEAVTGAPQAGIPVEELGLRRREQSLSRCCLLYTSPSPRDS